MALARFGLNRLLLAPYLRNVAVSRYSDTRRVIEQGRNTSIILFVDYCEFFLVPTSGNYMCIV